MQIIGIFLVIIFISFISIIKYAEKLELEIDDNWSEIVKVMEIKISKTNMLKDYLEKEIGILTEEINDINHTIKRLRLSTSLDLKFDFYINLNYNIVDLVDKYRTYPQINSSSTFSEIMLEYDSVNITDCINDYNNTVDKYNIYINEPIIRMLIKIFKYKNKKEINMDIFNNIRRTNH